MSHFSNDPEYVCQECGLTYGRVEAADVCAAVDRRRAAERMIGL